MIGRGAVSDPFLALRIRGLMDPDASGEEWPAVLDQLADYLRKLQVRVASRHEHGRVKMWLSYLERTGRRLPELASHRRLHDPHEILEAVGVGPLAFNDLITGTSSRGPRAARPGNASPLGQPVVAVAVQ